MSDNISAANGDTTCQTFRDSWFQVSRLYLGLVPAPLGASNEPDSVDSLTNA